MADFNTFWETYPADLCNRKGSKTMAEKSWNKIDSTLYEQIIINMREMMRADRKVKKTGAGKPEWIWPMAVTWLNQSRWDCMEDIKQSADIHADVRECSCGKPAQIVNECGDCFDERTGYKKARDKRLLANLAAIGLARIEGETRPEWNARCKAYITKKGGLGGVTKKLMG